MGGDEKASHSGSGSAGRGSRIGGPPVGSGGSCNGRQHRQSCTHHWFLFCSPCLCRACTALSVLQQGPQVTVPHMHAAYASSCADPGQRNTPSTAHSGAPPPPCNTQHTALRSSSVRVQPDRGRWRRPTCCHHPLFPLAAAGNTGAVPDDRCHQSAVPPCLMVILSGCSHAVHSHGEGSAFRSRRLEVATTRRPVKRNGGVKHVRARARS